MTREEIRRTIDGLERLRTDEGLSGDDRAIARDALTLLREIAAVNLPTITGMMEEFDRLDEQRKAVGSE
jgi:hypothetical protein